VRQGNSTGDWNTTPMSCRGPSSLRSPNRTVPELVGINPARIRSNVDFPQPDGPHDRDEFAETDIQVDVLERGHGLPATAEQLAELVDADEIA